MCKVLFLVNHDVVIYNFRLELVEKLIEDGHQVVISSPYGERIGALVQLGCEYHEIHFSRHGMNPWKEAALIAEYRKLIKSVSPDLVFTYTIKPNIYGGMACAEMGVPYVANITGLGIAVENSGIMRNITLLLYRYGLRKAKKVFFQNSDNLAFMQKHNVLRAEYDLLPGSGVNLERNCFEEYPENDGTETFLFIGRLMKDKGIVELVKAAKRICPKYSNVRFATVGFCEPDYQEELKKLEADRYISIAGEQKNVHEWIKRATAIVQPSYHEGMSNALLEAAASGRPVLASAIPGCRETFEEGVSGFGFLPRNVDSLCETIEKFINLPYEVKCKMGRAGRRKMEKEFDRKIVVNKYMEIVKEVEGEE